MNQVKKVILNVMEDNCDINLMVPYQRELLSELCEQALTKAVIAQVAELLGASLEFDNNGQAVIYTGVNFQEQAQADEADDDENMPIHDFLG
jgi:GH25 family lysozyme M1 (1,4-beta-N-acetylmuramidase)